MAAYGENGVALRFGDVYGAGTRMGVGMLGVIKRIKDRGCFFEYVLGVFTMVPMVVWVGFFLLHYVGIMMIRLPMTAGLFETKKACVLGGYLPSLCRDVGPHWTLTMMKFGVGGMFQAIGTLGMALDVILWEEKHSVLLLQQAYIRKAAFFWVLFVWVLPSFVSGVLQPVDLVFGYVIMGSKFNATILTLMVVATCMVRFVTAPLLLFYLALVWAYGWVHIGNDEITAPDRVRLTGWTADVFGDIYLGEDAMKLVELILEVDTQDVFWPEVRVMAYTGDKVASVYDGLIGLRDKKKIGDIHEDGLLFTDVNLNIAMRYFAKEWWDKHNSTMKGKAATTVLEALAYVVMLRNDGYIGKLEGYDIFGNYKRAIKRAVDFAQYGTPSGSDDSDVFSECK